MSDFESGLHIPSVEETLKDLCEGTLPNGREFETFTSRRNGLEYEGGYMADTSFSNLKMPEIVKTIPMLTKTP